MCETKTQIGLLKKIMHENNLTRLRIGEDYRCIVTWYSNAGESYNDPIVELHWDGVELSFVLDTFNGTIIQYEDDPAFQNPKVINEVLAYLLTQYTDPRSKRPVSMKELVTAVTRLEGGGAIDVVGQWRGKDRKIRIEQTVWCQTPVCLIGGYGHEVSSLHPRDVQYVLYCVLGNYIESPYYITEE